MRHPLDPALLAQIPLFEGVDLLALSDVAGTNALVTVSRDAILFRQGDPCTGMYFVCSGRMRLTVSSRSGAATTVEIIGSGETFGEAVVFLGRPYPVTASALAHATLYFISTHFIDEMLARDTQVARRLLANLAMRNHRLVADVAAVTLMSTSSRVCGYLLRLCPQPWTHEPVTLTLADAKRVIADRLSVTPESLSRALRQLTDRRLITMSGRTITCVPTALADQLGARGNEYPGDALS